MLAIFGYGAASVCYFFALNYADAVVVAVLLYAYPAFVTLASWTLLGEKASWQRGAAVLVTFLGCALVVGLVGGAARAQWQGIVLGLGAALGYTMLQPAVAPLAAGTLAAGDDDVHVCGGVADDGRARAAVGPVAVACRAGSHRPGG